MTARSSASAGTWATRPRRGWSWVIRHPSGNGSAEFAEPAATLGPEACCRPTVVGLTVPLGARRPGIQVTVGTLWVDPPRKANGPGAGGSYSSSITG